MTKKISAELAAIIAVADDGTHTEIDEYGIKIWRNAAGKIHRDGDLPAVILSDGEVFYYKDGNQHRGGDLPAVIRSNGSMYYYKNGKIHRDGGKPAVILYDGTVYYYKNGKQYTPKTKVRRNHRSSDL